MPGTFKAMLGNYGRPAIQMNRATDAQVAFLQKAIGAAVLSDPFYQAKLPADPIFQGISEDFVYVDFGCDLTTADQYVAWLNEVYDATIQALGFPLI